MATSKMTPVDDFLIADITRDPGVQIRKNLDQEAIDEYAELNRAGHKPPRVRMFRDGHRNWLSRGFHRIEAMLQAGGERIDAEYTEGTRRDAILDCLSANKENGVRLTSEDKKRGIERLLSDPEWSTWSDREIARHLRVAHGLVSSTRTSLSQCDSDDRTASSSADQSEPSSLSQCDSEVPALSSLPTGSSDLSSLSQADSEGPGQAEADRGATRKRRSAVSLSTPVQEAEESAAPEPVEGAEINSEASKVSIASDKPLVRKYTNRYGKKGVMHVSKIGKPGKAAGLPKPVDHLLKSLPRHVSARRDSHRPTVFVVRVGSRAKFGYSATPSVSLGQLLQSPDVTFVGAAAGSSEDAQAIREALSAEFGTSGWRTMSSAQVVEAMRRRGLDVVLMEDGSAGEPELHDLAESAEPAALDSSAENSELSEAPSVPVGEAQTRLSCTGSLDDMATRLGRPLTKVEVQLLAYAGDQHARLWRMKGLMHGRGAFQMPTVDIEREITNGIKDIKRIEQIVS